MNPSSSIPSAAEVIAAPLTWEVDPEDVGWLRAVFEEAYVYLRINNFPDENMYSLWLGDDRFLELEDLPANWTRRGPLQWPTTARPRVSSDYM